MEKSGERTFERKELAIIFAISVLAIISIPAFIFPEIIGQIIKGQKNQVQFYFYDEPSNCSLDGYVFMGNKLVGRAEDGQFNLAYENYLQNFNTEDNISLFGKLGACFGKNNEFLFDKYWKNFEIEKYYFDGESVFNFKTNINSNNPTKRELLGFIQPHKVKPELSEMNLKDNTLNDLSEINQYLNDKIEYVQDWDFIRENYWQTPLETLALGSGDCEDYGSTLLSLFLAYDGSLNCYNIIFSSHVTAFCYVQDYYIYYDQEKTELRKQIKNKNAETKSELIGLKEDYFEHYGINNTERAHYAFNENQFIEFENEAEFIDWQYNLNKKEEFDIFERLEQEVKGVEEKYPIQNQELATSSVLASEKPTLGSFFAENFTLLIILGAIFIILVVTLIIINVKK